MQTQTVTKHHTMSFIFLCGLLKHKPEDMSEVSSPDVINVAHCQEELIDLRSSHGLLAMDLLSLKFW